MSDLYHRALALLAANPGLLQELPRMPNVELQAMDQGIFWRDLANAGGWRIQEQVLLGNCRILDPNSVRKAWGGRSAMEEVFHRIVGSQAGEQPRGHCPLTVTDRSSQCVVLVPGLGRRRTSLRKMAQALEQVGYNVVGWSYPNLAIDITEAANRLLEVVQLNLACSQQVHLVTHSLGGIVTRRMLKLHPLERIGALVMIAPPNRGSALARFLQHKGIGHLLGPALNQLVDENQLESTCAVPDRGILIIAGTRHDDWKNPATWLLKGVLDCPHDGTVTVEETKLPCMAGHVTVDASHTWIMNHPEVIDRTLAFVDAAVQADWAASRS